MQPEKCPICNRYMMFSMQYNAGRLYTVWRCMCGYDTSRIQYHYDTKTSFAGSFVKNTCISETKSVG